MADLNGATGELTGLLRQTTKAHHDAFIDTDGFDPEWPLWYATFLHERLPVVQGVALTQSEWVFLIVKAEQQRLRERIEEPWYDFYARVIEEEMRTGSPLSAG
ncbi:MAG: hypothetical protein R2844_20010 [Caldilineales bacterium]